MDIVCMFLALQNAQSHSFHDHLHHHRSRFHGYTACSVKSPTLGAKKCRKSEERRKQTLHEKEKHQLSDTKRHTRIWMCMCVVARASTATALVAVTFECVRMFYWGASRASCVLLAMAMELSSRIKVSERRNCVAFFSCFLSLSTNRLVHFHCWFCGFRSRWNINQSIEEDRNLMWYTLYHKTSNEQHLKSTAIRSARAFYCEKKSPNSFWISCEVFSPFRFVRKFYFKF